MQTARAAWEVTAGIIPLKPEATYTRRFVLTGDDPDEKFLALRNQALDYARDLMDPGLVNWVRLHFIWF